MNQDICDVISELNRLLPQLADFISQFKTIIIDTEINVVSDAQGNMSIDVPINMLDTDANNISTRIGIIDRFWCLVHIGRAGKLSFISNSFLCTQSITGYQYRYGQNYFFHVAFF